MQRTMSEDGRNEFSNPQISRLENMFYNPELRPLLKRGSTKTFSNLFTSLFTDLLDPGTSVARHMYSGTVVVYRVYNKPWVIENRHLYALLVFVGKYVVPTLNDAEEDVMVFAERETGQLLATNVEDDFLPSGLAKGFYTITHPLRIEEFGENVHIASVAHARLLDLAIPPSPGFETPLYPRTIPGLVALPIDAMTHLLREGAQDVYVTQSFGRGLVRIHPNVLDGQQGFPLLASEGYDGVVVPQSREATSYYGVNITRIAMTPLQLRNALEHQLIFCRVSTITDSTPWYRFVPNVWPLTPKQAFDLHPGLMVAIQPSVVPNLVQMGEVVGFGMGADGRRMLLLHMVTLDGVQAIPTAVPFEVIQYYTSRQRVWSWLYAHTEGRYAHVETKFATALPPTTEFPTVFEPTRVKDDERADYFYDLVKTEPCTRDAWIQRKGTCWAASILNVITLTPTLREVFLSKHIETGPLNPEGDAALAVQRAVACKSTDDAPFCAFAGPEMVCQLLRIKKDAGASAIAEFMALMNAAGIELGNGTIHSDPGPRFHLVHVCTVNETGYTTITVPDFDVMTHAVSGFVCFVSSETGHGIAGIRCPSSDPEYPYDVRYYMPDSYRVLEYNWLVAAVWDGTTLEKLQAELKMTFDYNSVQFWVLCDLETTIEE